MSGLKKVIDLLKEWDAFQDAGNEKDFALFGDWLKNKFGIVEASGSMPFSMDDMITYKLASILLFAEKWSRLTFEQTPIRTIADYGVLKSIQVFKNPTKKQVVTESLLETSTCLEILKRFSKNKLIKEEVDHTDKRVRRVCLTSYGVDVMKKLDAKTSNLSKLLVGNLSNDLKGDLLSMLSTLTDFHNNLHRTQTKDHVKEMYNLQ